MKNNKQNLGNAQKHKQKQQINRKFYSAMNNLEFNYK